VDVFTGTSDGDDRKDARSPLDPAWLLNGLLLVGLLNVPRDLMGDLFLGAVIANFIKSRVDDGVQDLLGVVVSMS
jgi:hypothetical protein